MATIIADNIITPLGFGTDTNFEAIIRGESGLKPYQPTPAIPFTYTASLFTPTQLKELEMEGYSKFESLAIRSISNALKDSQLPMDAETVLILASTKGNVGDLKDEEDPEGVLSLGYAAKRVAKACGFSTEPIVVCNACISGVSALILAERLLRNRSYEYAVVCGVDAQNPFVISGFQSFKALSGEECRPFDLERLGLNLGEGAATLVLAASDSNENAWHILEGAQRNDAYHISTPAPNGEGALRAINASLKGFKKEDIGLLNVHGTATMYNDQMESQAVVRAGLSEIPANALKGYLGHTMGAAGVVEVALCMRSLDKGRIPGTRGFEELGVSGKVELSPEERSSDSDTFLKMISGFGGCNAAILLSRRSNTSEEPSQTPNLQITKRVRITPVGLEIGGEKVDIPSAETPLLKTLYKKYLGDYPKFYKMDPMARLGFLAAEILLAGRTPDENTDSTGIILFNSRGSLHADLQYYQTIKDPENYFPSPSLFVYTLPNIVCGEIAIRHKITGETAFYILPERDQARMEQIILATLRDKDLQNVVAGWVDYTDPENFEADLFLATN